MGSQSFTNADVFAITYNAYVPHIRIHVRDENLIDQIKDKEKQNFIERHFIPREDVENG